MFCTDNWKKDPGKRDAAMFLVSTLGGNITFLARNLARIAL